MKFIIVTGGVVSGLGKGIISSSIGLLLQSIGYKVTAIKIDPYINVDAGTMSPYEHGECYVLQDGNECDLDLGNYERFLNIQMTKQNNITTGSVYNSVITKERNGEYLGETVQIVPHITNEIKQKIRNITDNNNNNNNNNNYDICLIELGGTINDMENMPFIEALRQMSYESFSNGDKLCFIHTSLVIENNGEIKTKPTQQSIEKLRSCGIIPNMLVLRTPVLLDDMIINKIGNRCGLRTDTIIQNNNLKHIYYVPNLLKSQGVIDKILNIFNETKEINYNLVDYYKILKYYETEKKHIKIGIVGKYIKTPDTYLSIIRAIESAAFINNVTADIVWINSEEFNKDTLVKCNGYLVPGGFGSRGIDGKLQILKYCRDNKIPVFGICLGMQLMVIDCANSIGHNCVSTEWTTNIEDTEQIPIIDLQQSDTKKMGGTMRLGNYTTQLDMSSNVYKLYSKEYIVERHRHRYEVNNKYLDIVKQSGLNVVGKDKDCGLVELVELDVANHPFYIGCQYHPEFTSTYNNPNPLFVGFINSCNNYNI